MALIIDVKRHIYDEGPAHHLPPSVTKAGLVSYMPEWMSGTTSTDGFVNPWPSWHKPSPTEVWRAFEWGDDTDPCIEIARRSADEALGSSKGNASDKDRADHLLKVTAPDFSTPLDGGCKTTWLGHAGILVQLPPLEDGGRPVRCLFDPMFSMRCSPSQYAGPIRSYPPPCAVEDLPPVDVVIISHSHFDHLDYDTIMALWAKDKKTVRFLVPLGNRKWFIDCGIDSDRVTECDWWDAARLSTQAGLFGLKITCTPAQHNSGRFGDANMSLWASWYIEHAAVRGTPYRIFFAGDTGYQWHESPGWPPIPPSHCDLSAADLQKLIAKVDDDSPTAKYPACPVFKQIAERLGAPDLLLLPVSVGATYDYLRSFSGPLPNSVNPFPRHSPGVTAHNHMPPWDAVRVLKVMTEATSTDKRLHPPTALAMHWGTFITHPTEVLKTLGQLEWACQAHGVDFARSIMARSESETSQQALFVALSHGESVVR